MTVMTIFTIRRFLIFGFFAVEECLNFKIANNNQGDVGDVANVQYWSRTVTIEVYKSLEHAVFSVKINISVSAECRPKYRRFFYNRDCVANCSVRFII
jgi:hypothetical protein